MNIVHFAIATNGVLTKKDSVHLPTAPVAMAVSPMAIRFMPSPEPPPQRFLLIPSLRALSAPSPTR